MVDNHQEHSPASLAGYSGGSFDQFLYLRPGRDFAVTSNTVEKSVLLPYSAQSVFEIIDRIEDYPGFLPWCDGTEVQRPEQGAITATIRIAFKGLRQQFTTHNRHREPANAAPGTITMELIEGPFTHLDGDWTIESLSESACKVSFRLDYQMRSGLLGRALSPIFGQIASTFIDAFVKEAERRFG